MNYLENPEYYRTEAKFVPEIRVYDIIKLFSKVAYGNGLVARQDYIGSIELELLSFKEKRSIGLTIFSLWTLCVPSLLGVPINNIKTELKIKVSIFNRKGEVIKTYVSDGFGNAFIAMYWGYGEDAWRKSVINAFNDAFEPINMQIDTDKEFIRLKLNE